MSQQNQYQNMQKYLQINKQAAPALLKRADALCGRLFASGDLISYLDLLCRLHQYDYRNLLLIWDQYPQAACLAAYRVWESLLPRQKGRVLKDAYIGKGIQLLAPFTEDREHKSFLTWYRVLQFDVSQTNVTEYPVPTSPYTSGKDHLMLLSDAARAVLGFLHQKSLLLVSQNNPALKPQLSYRITAETVVIRSKESLFSRLQLMVEAMAQLTAMQSALPSAQHLLFSQCFCYCLMSIWGYANEVPLPMSGKQITSVPSSVQPAFLDVLQKSLRSHDELTACAYNYLRNEAASDFPEEDLLDLLGYTGRDAADTDRD